MSRMLSLRLFCLSKTHPQFPPLFQFLSKAHGSSSAQVNGVLQNHVELWKSRKRPHEFRTFCTLPGLASKKCVPCNSEDIRPMREDLANELIAEVPGWNLVNEEGKLKLSRSWKVKTFTKGLEFFQAVANVAEAEGHHPDLHLVGWNNITVEIWTHSVGKGLKCLYLSICFNNYSKGLLATYFSHAPTPPALMFRFLTAYITMLLLCYSQK